MASRDDLMTQFVQMGARYVSTGTDLAFPDRRQRPTGKIRPAISRSLGPAGSFRSTSVSWLGKHGSRPHPSWPGTARTAILRPSLCHGRACTCPLSTDVCGRQPRHPHHCNNEIIICSINLPPRIDPVPQHPCSLRRPPVQPRPVIQRQSHQRRQHVPPCCFQTSAPSPPH